MRSKNEEPILVYLQSDENVIKKYIGTSHPLLTIIMLPVLLCLLPLSLSILALTSSISFITIVIALFGIGNSINGLLYIIKRCRIVYSRAWFKEECIEIHSLFQEKRIIRYDEIQSSGIAVYKHAYMNNPNGLGTNVFFLYISKGFFNEKYRYQVNLWKMSSVDLKVEFDKNLYEFLIKKLPTKPTLSLTHDYKEFEQYIRKRRKYR